MAESTLSLTRTDLLNEIGMYAFGRVYASCDTNQQAQATYALDSGLRDFYTPPPIPGERDAHSWSFMKPIGSLSLAADQWQYDLPDDFAGFTEAAYFSADDSSFTKIHLTNAARILSLREGDDAGYSGPPELIADVVIGPTDSVLPTRRSMMVWPTPDATYTLNFPYLSNPFQLSASATYPLGGQPHAETLRQSCLAAAERGINDTMGIHNSRYMVRLAASVHLDRRLNGPKHYGYNGDRRGSGRLPMRHPNRGLVTYNGITPGD